MADQRKPRAAVTPARDKIRQLELRLARLEAEIQQVQGGKSPHPGRTRPLPSLERVQASLAQAAARLGQAIPGSRDRAEVRQQILRARDALKDSIDRLSRAVSESQRTMGRLTRGIKAGVKAGHAAYRRPRG